MKKISGILNPNLHTFFQNDSKRIMEINLLASSYGWENLNSII